MKKIPYYLLAVIITSFTLVACKGDKDEETSKTTTESKQSVEESSKKAEQDRAKEEQFNQVNQQVQELEEEIKSLEKERAVAKEAGEDEAAAHKAEEERLRAEVERLQKEADLASPKYIRVSDANLYLHANGGSIAGAEQTLHPCPKESNHPNCQWVFEPSGTRSGAYYIKTMGADLYLHADGGSNAGAQETLHSCPKENDHPNCQWTLEPSGTRSGAYYIKTTGANLYLHADGGSNEGAKETLHPCPKENDHGNCQWIIEGWMPSTN